MEWLSGDMLQVAREEECEIIAFTANSVLKSINGSQALVMGGGAAKRVRDAFPGIDIQLAEKIIESRSIDNNNSADYYVVASKTNGLWVAAVQVKRHWKDDGDWKLTETSLKTLARHLSKNPNRKCVLNCPLIGLGGFSDRIDDVKQMVEDTLKDANVFVCII